MTAEAWKALVERLEAVLQVFGSFSGAADASSEPSEAAGAGAPAAHPTEGATAIDTAIDTAMDAAAALGAVADHLEGSEAAEVYFAKFLTSAKLMTLQLRDGYFRRHVLVQVPVCPRASSSLPVITLLCPSPPVAARRRPSPSHPLTPSPAPDSQPLTPHPLTPEPGPSPSPTCSGPHLPSGCPNWRQARGCPDSGTEPDG